MQLKYTFEIPKNLSLFFIFKRLGRYWEKINYFSGLLVTSLISATVWGCGESNTSSTQKITVNEAISRAQERIAKDENTPYDYEGRDTSVVEENGMWHLSFPFKRDTINYIFGGGPHVIISPRNGEIDSVYYTR